MQKAKRFFKKAAMCFLGIVAIVLLLTGTTFVFLWAPARLKSVEAPIASETPVTSSSVLLESSSQTPLTTWEFTGQLDDWRLLLVNFEIPMPENTLPELESIGNIQVDKRITDDLQAMIDAAQADGISLTLSSGYRSAQRQEELFKKAVEDNLSLGMNLEMADAVAAESVARAGYSEHNTGLAIDFNGVLETFDETPEYRWLQRHAYEFGFILRYPQEKAEITGIRFEPWHFRYVGAEHAEKMRLLHLCLEEYVAYLTEQKKSS